VFILLCCGRTFAVCFVITLVFQEWTKRLSGRNVSEMIYLVSGGTWNLTQSIILMHWTRVVLCTCRRTAWSKRTLAVSILPAGKLLWVHLHLSITVPTDRFRAISHHEWIHRAKWRHRIYCHETIAILWVQHGIMCGVKDRRFIVLFTQHSIRRFMNMSVRSLACNEVYLSDITVKNISKSFTHKMAAKASWHWNYATVALCIGRCVSRKPCSKQWTVNTSDKNSAVQTRAFQFAIRIYSIRFVMRIDSNRFVL